MFGWFQPTCPCDPAAKHWVEDRLLWLSRQFGLHILLERPIILPTSEFFPDDWDGSKKSAHRLFKRVCKYMDVDPARVKLKIVHNPNKLWLVNEGGDYLPNAAGTYEDGGDKALVTVDRDEFADPMNVVGTMAHELAHVRLLGEGRLDGTVYDNELLTDLTVVYHGMGIFLANKPRNWDSAYSLWPGTTLKKPEYMTPPMFGWALAHLAWHRDEPTPAWASHLHWNAHPDFKQALRYLHKTADSNFKPARLP